MHMGIIVAVSIILACLPLLMAIFFVNITLGRKADAIKDELRKLRGTPSGVESTTQGGKNGPEDTIDLMVKKLYGGFTLSSPALLLTVFYVGWILLGDAFLNKNFSSGETWFFPAKLVDKVLPMLYTFIGIYLFNLGNLMRRLYLGDLNEQVFWGAINRLWLSLGLGLVVTEAFPSGSASLFFSIGFIANIILDWSLDKTLKLLNVTQPKSEDLPLQMVKGINIWKAYRLEEEGIENVQNLATADVTELAVRTHYSFRTLIDWIDQSLLLVRLTSEQAKTLGSQATAISAIELAAVSPKASGNNSVANALATVLKIDPVLMGATMDRLYEDQFVQDLWNLWQKGKEGGTLPPSSAGSTAKAAAAGGGAD